MGNYSLSYMISYNYNFVLGNEKTGSCRFYCFGFGSGLGLGLGFSG
jgi:hypothetical protein